MDLDIESLIDWEAESNFGFEQEMYDYDISNIAVEIRDFRIVGAPNIRPVRLQVIDVIDKVNCTHVAQSSSFPEYNEEHSESFTVTFGGTVKWGSTVTGELGIPGGITVGGARTQDIELTGSASHTTSSTTAVRHAGNEVIIPPCKRVRATREIWRTEVSGRVQARIRIHGRVTYSVAIDNWPDPQYSQDLDFLETIDGDFTAVGGYEIRGGYHESAAQCSPPCASSTANACRIDLGQPRPTAASQAPVGLAFRSKVTMDGIPGAAVGTPFAFEDHGETALMLAVSIVAETGGFAEIVGTSSVRVPLVGQLGYRKLSLPVTCRLPGEIIGSTEKTVTMTVIQPVKIEMLQA